MAGVQTLELAGLKAVPSPSTAEGSEHNTTTESNISRQIPPTVVASVPVILEKAAVPQPNILQNQIKTEDVDCIGGIYDKTIHRSVWKVQPCGPYLEHIKNLSKGWPHLEWLTDYMEVGTTPVKWKFLTQGNIKERAERTRIAVLDFSNLGDPLVRDNIQDSGELREKLGGQRLDKIDLSVDPAYARLFIVEDMSRDVIEALGAKYDIDPQYFRSQISDFLWYNIKDPWVELQDLPHIAAGRNYYNIRYMTARYFQTEAEIEKGKEQLGHFNVLRRLEEDLSWYVRKLKKPEGPTVGVIRSKTALWIRKKKNEDEAVIGILVVDPEITAGYPLWGGHRNLQPCPGMGENVPEEKHPRSLFEGLCHYADMMTPEQVKSFAEEPRALGLPIISLVAAEWMSVVSYIITGLTKIEYELEHPFYRRNSDGLAGLLDRLHPLRRLLPVYRMMICETLNTFLNKDYLAETKAEPTTTHLKKLRSDFEAILQSIDQLQIRTQNIISLATTIIGVEENQRAMQMNKNLVRVTYLAVVFAPMAFISSFFSMAPDLGSLKNTVWIYFSVAVPLTMLCLFFADRQRFTKHGKRLFGIKDKEKGKEEESKK